MEFLKKHYEKVLLGVVLLGLAAGAVFLILMIPTERAALRAQSEEIIKKPVKPLPPLEMTQATALIGRVGGWNCLDLSVSNKVFNSVPWLRKGEDNSTLKKLSLGNEIGIDAVQVTDIRPLYTTISFEGVSETPTAERPARYDFIVEKEAAAKASQRTKKHMGASLNVKDAKNDTFTIREVKGPPENPTELVLELTDSTERASVSRDKPYKRVDGYVADFKYPPENKNWKDQRVGAGGPGMPVIKIGEETYKVVAINKNEVVFSANSNNKKTPRPLASAR